MPSLPRGGDQEAVEEEAHGQIEVLRCQLRPIHLPRMRPRTSTGVQQFALRIREPLPALHLPFPFGGRCTGKRGEGPCLPSIAVPVRWAVRGEVRPPAELRAYAARFSGGSLSLRDFDAFSFEVLAMFHYGHIVTGDEAGASCSRAHMLSCCTCIRVAQRLCTAVRYFVPVTGTAPSRVPRPQNRRPSGHLRHRHLRRCHHPSHQDKEMRIRKKKRQKEEAAEEYKGEEEEEQEYNPSPI